MLLFVKVDMKCDLVMIQLFLKLITGGALSQHQAHTISLPQCKVTNHRSSGRHFNKAQYPQCTAQIILKIDTVMHHSTLTSKWEE